MKFYPLAGALILGAGLLSAPVSVAEGLPDLGEAAQSEFSPAMERRIGESVMLEIRRDPAWLDDPEITGYLNRIGNRLAAQSEDARQEFEFFALRDSTLNAFAMPGGYIGVHTGLILAAASESELASVLAHEISHVTQRHLARMVNKAGQGQVTSLLALAVAILAARSNPDLAMGAVMAGQGVAIQNQLNYSRDFEREADRTGLSVLERSGFDIRGMSSFFERLQKSGRLYENNAPGYLRTHPLTTERLADMGNRIQSRPYRQVPDSLEFQLVRAKLRSQEGTPRDAVTEFETRLNDRSFAGSEAAVRYGLAQARLRDGNPAAAEKELGELRRLKAQSPMIETLAAQLRLKQGDAAAAVRILRDAQPRFPQERAIAYSLVEALLEVRQPQQALKATEDDLLHYPSDARMHALQARTYALLGKRLLQHRALGESYALQGQLAAAVEQMELAQKAGDGNFYEQSQVDSRLREMKKRLADETRQAKEAKEKNSPMNTLESSRRPDVRAGIHTLATPLVRPASEPYYHAVGDELEVFAAAAQSGLPVMLKGPTGCGKTRFVEHMAWRLKRPLVTVACHDDLTTADLVGRYLIVGDETVWMDGPLTAAVRAGAICYLDEIVEARKDTTVVIHPLTDSRRALPVEKRGEYLEAPPDFMLVISYNPGYQSVLKEMKPSTRQRFVALDFDYPDAATEARIVSHEGGVDAATAQKLVKLGGLTRKLKGAGLDEGAGTRLLVHAAQLIAKGMNPATACTAAIARPLADEPDTRNALDDLIAAVF